MKTTKESLRMGDPEGSYAIRKYFGIGYFMALTLQAAIEGIWTWSSISRIARVGDMSCTEYVYPSETITLYS